MVLKKNPQKTPNPALGTTIIVVPMVTGYLCCMHHHIYFRNWSAG